MSKIDLDPITSGYNLSKINANFQKVEDALNEEVLYRKSHVGEPNEMQTNLDMNGKRILNISIGSEPNDLATRGYVDQEIAETVAYVDQQISEERSYVDQNLSEIDEVLPKKYDKDGGPLFGDIQMNWHNISDLGELKTLKTSTKVLEINGVQVTPGSVIVDPYNGTREALRRGYLEAGYQLSLGSFEVGSTITTKTQALLLESSGKAYSWGGPLPKIVPSGSTPDSSGGVGPTAWQDRSPDTSGIYVAAGLDPSGIILGTDALQQVITSIQGGVLVIPPGTYNIGDISIAGKAAGSTGAQGGFQIEATGVKFVGGGKIVIDGCKRVQINGLDAPNHDLCFRGQWWGKYSNMRFKYLRLGDALGSDFQSNYWTDFDTCVYQKIIFEQTATENSNAFTWTNCSSRGNAGQGFTATADYAIELLANQNAQNWRFIGGDISYHTQDVYNIGAGNTTGQVELLFSGVYFDLLYPTPINRDRSRVVVEYGHSANNFANSAPMSAVARGAHDSFRADRAAGWVGFSGFNLIPNGDLRVGMPTYAGVGKPIGSSSGATVTAGSGAGLYGRYLNINQLNLGVAGQVRFRPKPLPFTGRHTAVMGIRNADVGTRNIRMSFNNLFSVVQVSNTDWTYYTLTSGTDLVAGTQPDITIRADDDVSPFNVDVCYSAITFGEGGMPFVPSPVYGEVIGVLPNYNPPDIANGAQASTTVVATGAVLGDLAVASFALDTLGLVLTARVTATDTVTVTFRNDTGASVNLAAADVNVRVFKI